MKIKVTNKNDKSVRKISDIQIDKDGYLFNKDDKPLLNKDILEKYNLIELAKSNPLHEDLYKARLKLGENEGRIIEDITDIKLETYIIEEKNKIGLIKSYSGYEESNPKFKEKFTIGSWINSNDISVGQSDNNTWYAQFSYRTDIDDYNIETFEFINKPDKNIVLKAQTINDIECAYFFNREDSFNFTCWECGMKQHFVDINEDDVIKKWEHFKDGYCGC